MLISCLYYLTTVITKTWECNPRARIWDKSIDGTCIDVSTILNVDGVFNTVSDILIIIVPGQALWNLKMRTKKKIAVLILFTVGLM